MMGRNVNWIETSLVLLLFSILLCLDNIVLAKKKKDDETIKKCETCLDLVKKFEEGMERTRRYNFAGGDVDWEEEKLGSYATSETRFIEITEQLCSSSAHECNRMLENQEEKLEEWWKTHQESDPDLEKWFCTDGIKVCCPKNTFGPDCEECVGGVDNPCTGNGKCSGGGTRGGSGKCKCNGGYKGTHCDVCKNGFYEELKNETHTICKACDESCASTCSGPGPKACKKCKGGYDVNEEEGCKDINECDREGSDREYPCDDDKEYCDNTKGSYKCVACDSSCNRCLGGGNTMCVGCNEGYQNQEGKCIDIDECEDKQKCTEDKMRCINLPGRYYCDCIEGFERMGGECVDSNLVEAMKKGKFELPEPELDVKDNETNSNGDDDTVNSDEGSMETSQENEQELQKENKQGTIQTDSDTNIPSDNTAGNAKSDSATVAEAVDSPNGSQQNDNLDDKNIEKIQTDQVNIDNQNEGLKTEL